MKQKKEHDNKIKTGAFSALKKNNVENVWFLFGSFPNLCIGKIAS